MSDGTGGTMSIRAFSRMIGRSDTAVRKAFDAGVFSATSIRRGEDGAPTVADVQLAVQEWEKSGRQLRGPERRPARSAPPAVAGRSSQPSADACTPAADTVTVFHGDFSVQLNTPEARAGRCAGPSLGAISLSFVTGSGRQTFLLDPLCAYLVGEKLIAASDHAMPVEAVSDEDDIEEATAP